MNRARLRALQNPKVDGMAGPDPGWLFWSPKRKVWETFEKKKARSVKIMELVDGLPKYLREVVHEVGDL